MEEWIPTAFSKVEIERVISLIPQTDPRSHDYSQVLLSLEQLFGIVGTIDTFLNSFTEGGGTIQESGEQKEPTKIIEFPKKPEPVSEPVMEEITESDKFDEPAPTDSTNVEEPPCDALALKTAIGKAKKDGVIPNLADWITDNFGVKGFASIPVSQYGKAVKLLNDLGVSV